MEEQLIFRAKSGETKAFTELVHSIENDLYRIARTRLNNDEDINDKDLKNSSEVRFQIYNTLKNSTNDFTGDVYKSTHQQDVSKIIK